MGAAAGRGRRASAGLTEHAHFHCQESLAWVQAGAWRQRACVASWNMSLDAQKVGYFRVEASLCLGRGQDAACLRGLVEHARVDRGRQQVVGGPDGVDVAGQVQVHLLHGHDLAGCRVG